MDTSAIIATVFQALRSVGFESPIQFALYHLYYSPPAVRTAFFQTPGDGTHSPFTNFIVDALRFPQAHIGSLARDPILCRAIYPIFGRALHDEAVSIQHALMKPLDEYNAESIEQFSMQRIGVLYKTNAPLTYMMATDLVELDDDVDVSKPPRATSSAPGKDHHNSKKALMVTSALSTLYYARNRLCNIVQYNIGYFLGATKTGKRTISALNGTGTSCSYETVQRLQAAIAKSARDAYRKHAATRPFVLSYDNMDYKVHVKTHLLHKNDHLQNDTAGYVYFQKGGAYDGLLKRASALDYNLTNTLRSYDLLPKDALNYHREAARSNVYNILIKYFPGVHDCALEFNGERPFVEPVRAINLLPLQKTEIYTLPTLELNEAKITDTISIIKAFTQELGIDLDKLHDRVVMFKGDYLTVRNVALAMFQRQDAAFIKRSETFDFIEPVVGLFHLVMNVQQVLVANYWGGKEGKDPGSLHRYANLTRNERIAKESKDFRATQSFLSDVLDGHVLGKIFQLAGVKTFDAFNTLVASAAAGKKTVNWAQLVNKVVDPLFDSTYIRDIRAKSKEERDILRENAHLMTRDLLVVRDYESAIKSGDTGRIEKVLEVWCVEYQATSKVNYASELVHMIACLKKLWKSPMRDHWLANCLVNPSGRHGGWMPDDLYGEYVIRENKARIHPSSNALTGDHNRNVHACQVMVYLASRRTMFETTGATNYYQKSTLANSRTHVKLFADNNVAAQLYKLTMGRHTNSGRDKFEYYSAKDLYHLGTQHILTAIPIQKYKRKSRVNWTTFKDAFDEEDEEDDDGRLELNQADDEMLDDLM